MSETWRPIPGYEGLYDVSDQGHVRSLQLPQGDKAMSGNDFWEWWHAYQHARFLAHHTGRRMRVRQVGTYPFRYWLVDNAPATTVHPAPMEQPC